MRSATAPPPTQLDNTPYLAFNGHKDPLLHTPVEWPASVAKQIAALKPKVNGFLLVPVGECASCVSVDLQSWDKAAAKRSLTLVLLTSAARVDAEEFSKRIGIKAPIVYDPGLKATNKINAVWTPRPYLFDRDKHLVWLQKERAINFDPFSDVGFNSAIGDAKQ